MRRSTVMCKSCTGVTYFGTPYTASYDRQSDHYHHLSHL